MSTGRLVVLTAVLRLPDGVEATDLRGIETKHDYIGYGDIVDYFFMPVEEETAE